MTAREDRRGGRRSGAGRKPGRREDLPPRWSIQLRAEPTERATIEAAAAALGVSVARYLLDAALARAAATPKEEP